MGEGVASLLAKNICEELKESGFLSKLNQMGDDLKAVDAKIRTMQSTMALATEVEGVSAKITKLERKMQKICEAVIKVEPEPEPEKPFVSIPSDVLMKRANRVLGDSDERGAKKQRVVDLEGEMAFPPMEKFKDIADSVLYRWEKREGKKTMGANQMVKFPAGGSGTMASGDVSECALFDGELSTEDIVGKKTMEVSAILEEMSRNKKAEGSESGTMASGDVSECDIAVLFDGELSTEDIFGYGTNRYRLAFTNEEAMKNFLTEAELESVEAQERIPVEVNDEGGRVYKMHITKWISKQSKIVLYSVHWKRLCDEYKAQPGQRAVVMARRGYNNKIVLDVKFLGRRN